MLSKMKTQDLVMMSVKIPFELKDKLKFRAYQEGRPLQEIITEALENSPMIKDTLVPKE